MALLDQHQRTALGLLRVADPLRLYAANLVIVALNDIGYSGPLSIEWEDSRMDRFHGATESCEFIKQLDFTPNQMAFDSAFDKENQ